MPIRSRISLGSVDFGSCPRAFEGLVAHVFGLSGVVNAVDAPSSRTLRTAGVELFTSRTTQRLYRRHRRPPLQRTVLRIFKTPNANSNLAQLRGISFYK